MKKVQILFGGRSGVYGAFSATRANFNSHLQSNRNLTDVQVDKLFPRGNTFWKINTLQLDKHAWGNSDD